MTDPNPLATCRSPVLLYYITDRTQFSGGDSARRMKLLERMSAAARSGVDFIQLREKDLSGRELESLAQDAVEAVRASSRKTHLLINSRSDIALAAGGDGVHLGSADISPAEVRKIWQAAGAGRKQVVAVSCHSGEDVSRAGESGANFVVFGPVFGKADVHATGVEGLRSAARSNIPVLALGGVNTANAASCIEAGAAGVAGIRLFQAGDLAETVAKLRSLGE